MKAFLLAGGYGTRLKPLTENTPKCLVGIAGRPLLDYWLDDLVSSGFKRILINTHYLNDQVEQFIHNSQYADIVTTVHEPQLLGTLGSIRKNRAFFDTDTTLIAHADNLCLTNWQAFLKAFHTRPGHCDMTMMLFHTPTPWSCGLVSIDHSGVLADYLEKPQAAKHEPERYGNLANAAVFLASQKALDGMCGMAETYDDLCRDYLPQQVGKANTFVNDDVHIDIGTPQSYSQANEIMQTRSSAVGE